MEHLKVILKGLWIGSTMTVPGVSGGTMAVIVGIYEDLIHAVNGLRKEPLKYIPFLLKFVLGAGVGFLVFARFVTMLLQGNMSGELIRFFFGGVVVGGIPLLVSKSQVKQIRPVNILSILAGAVIVLLLAKIPQGIFYGGSGIKYMLLQFVGGVLIAIALILPGISASHMLYILGLYELIVEHIYALEIIELIPLMLGGIIGTFVTTDILEKLINKHTTAVYMIIIGFVAGSMVTLVPKGGIHHPFMGGILFIIGFISIYYLSKKADK